MAVRVVALLIPLAITLPQLRANIDAAAPQEQAAQAAPSPSPEWSYDTRRIAAVAFTRIALESPLHNAVDTTLGQAAVTVAPAASKAPPTRKRMSPQPMTSAKAALGSDTRQVQRPLQQAACPPLAHCAPVVVAKVTPVTRKAL